MRFARILGFVGASAGIFACGGSSNGSSADSGSDAGTPDSAAVLDAATVCAQSGTLNPTAPLDFTTTKLTGTAPTGDQLTVVVVVTFSSAPTTGFVIIQRNTAGVFAAATGAAGRFETPPVLGSYPMDTDDQLGFGIDFVDGITTNTDGTVTIKPTQVQVLDPTAGGTVKLDRWTAKATPGGTTTIGATITNATFRGFNTDTSGNIVAANGCDVTIQNLQFTNMTVTWQTAAFPAVAAAGPAPLAALRRSFDGVPAIQMTRD